MIILCFAQLFTNFIDQQSSEQSVDVKKILIIIIPTVTGTVTISLGMIILRTEMQS